MRLDDYDPSAIDVVDQRGSGFSIGGAGGRIGCGTIIIALIGYFFFGADPGQLIGGLQQADVGQGTVQTQGGTTTAESCAVNAYSHEACNALSSLNKTWEPLFQQANIGFKRPTLNFYSQAGRSGCGAGSGSGSGCGAGAGAGAGAGVSATVSKSSCASGATDRSGRSKLGLISSPAASSTAVTVPPCAPGE